MHSIARISVRLQIFMCMGDVRRMWLDHVDYIKITTALISVGIRDH